MEERVFLEERGVVVTGARFVLPGRTYAIANVTSVAHVEREPHRTAGIAMFLVGLLLSVTSVRVVGVLLAAIGAVWALGAKGKYEIRLSGADGETSAFRSPDRALVRRIAAALNEAIAFRG